MVFNLFLISIIINQAHAASVTGIKWSLNDPIINLVCTYQVNSGEVFNRMVLKKEGVVFYTGTASNPNGCNFTSTEGVDLIKCNGLGNITIKNYELPNTTGLYECGIYYDATGAKDHYVMKQYNINIQVGPCTYSWVNASLGNIPSGAFVAAVNGQDKQYIFCRSMTSDPSPCPGYYDPAVGCTITMGGQIQNYTTFQVVTGKGLSWGYQMNDSNKALPPNALAVGQDQLGPTYYGRDNINGTAYVGKISDHWYFNMNGVELNQTWTFVLTCKP